MAHFCARYQDPASPFTDMATAGVEHFDAESKAELLQKALAEEGPGKRLALISIQEFGSSNPVWNAKRIEEHGHGWKDDMLELYFLNGFPEE